MSIFDWLADKINPSKGGDQPGLPGQPEKAEPHSSTFTDIIRGFQHCVLRAQEINERHNLEILDRYFVEEKDEKTGKIKQYPKMLTFQLMKDNWMHVPLITLVDPNTLRIEELEVEMAMRVNKQTIKKASKEEHAHKDKTTRASFSVSFTSMNETNGGGKENAIWVKMKFVAPKEPSEGMMRIIDEYRKTLYPVPKGEGEEGGGPAGANVVMNGGGPGSMDYDGDTEAKKGDEPESPATPGPGEDVESPPGAS